MDDREKAIKNYIEKKTACEKAEENLKKSTNAIYGRTS